MKKKEILMATAGVNPQIVTISLDLLARQGCHIDEVVSIYTDNKFVKEALDQLDVELQRLGGLSHRCVLISNETGSIRDFLTEADATALLQVLYREVKAYKQAGYRIHFMIAGGRRVMSAYALVIAQLLFDEADRVWHLFSDFWQENRNRKMHVEPGDYAILVPVPVLRWTPMTSVVTDLALTNDPWQVINRQHELQQREHDQHLRAFLRGLTEAQRQVARLLAAGLDNKAIAVHRRASLNTVTKQISAIYDEWRTFFGLPEGISVRDRVIAELAGYFARQGG